MYSVGEASVADVSMSASTDYCTALCTSESSGHRQQFMNSSLLFGKLKIELIDVQVLHLYSFRHGNMYRSHRSLKYFAPGTSQLVSGKWKGSGRLARLFNS